MLSSHIARSAQDKDLQYRKFSAAVDKTLLSFEAVAEWADFITFLAKLLKVMRLHGTHTLLKHRCRPSRRIRTSSRYLTSSRSPSV
jgi:hypothetical protein